MVPLLRVRRLGRGLGFIESIKKRLLAGKNLLSRARQI
jgi:hypothetical protein